MKFAQRYVNEFRDTLGEPLCDSDGITNSEIDCLLDGKIIPAAMRDYYRVAGKHWLNTNHHTLRTLDALESFEGHTIFMDENQCVVRWAIRDSELTDEDPIVYQGQEFHSGYEWHAENDTFSRFIIATWKWLLTGEGTD